MPQPDDPARPPPHALLLVAPGCPHCATVLDGLAALVKEGTLGRVEVVNIAVEPEAARELNVRSVPWTRIGPFELAGLHSLEELRHWSALVGRDEGMTEFLADLLATGRRAQVAGRVRREPGLIARLADLIGDSDSELSVRIGVMATLEELQEEDLLTGQATWFMPLTGHADPRVRADACHALTLTGGPEALDTLRHCADDPDPVVRETAADGIDLLSRTND
jgi:hypothetical protein